MNGIDIAVVIPLYNQAGHVVDTIASIQAQTVPPAQVIVVDDGSTDNPRAALKSFMESGAIQLVHQENQGVTGARNRGLQEVTADWVVFLDADDHWSPEFLQRVSELAAAHPECGVVATNYVIVDENGVERAPLLQNLPSDDNVFVFTNYFESASRSTPPLWTGAVVMRTDVIRQIGGFRECHHDGEDLLAWAELYCVTDIVYTREVLAIYRQTSFSWTHYRRPASEVDITGNRLLELLNDPDVPAGKKRGLRAYVALWKKIRASQWIRNGRPMKAWTAAAESIRFNPGNWKVYAYFPFAILPRAARESLVRSVEKRVDASKGRI